MTDTNSTTIHALMTHGWDKDFSQRVSTRMPGTEDWVVVAELSDGGGYEWTEFKAYYSPSARHYFWYGDSGCSCNSWDNYISCDGDFENGSRDDVLRAWQSFAEQYTYDFTTEDRLNGSAKIRLFKEPK